MAKVSEKYLAGFLDSDGSIQVSFPKNSKRPTIKLTFSQKECHNEVLKRIHRDYGGTFRTQTINGNNYTDLNFCKSESIKILNRIRKHLVIKRYYADFCLEMLNSTYSSMEEVIAMKKQLKEARKRKSLPLPNYPSRKWLAGYFDGDGCLSVASVHKVSGTANLVAHIASSNFDTEGLEIIAKNFGGRIHDMAKGRCRQCIIALAPSKAIKFLEYFGKYSIVKKTQIDLVLYAARMGHFRDGKNIKAALKELKARPHRLSELTLLKNTIRDLPKYKRTDYKDFVRDASGRIIGKRDAIVETN